MNTLYFDTETYCETPIKNGTYRYAEDAEIMIASWAWNDDPPTVWDLTAGYATLADIQALIDQADEIVIQNSMFDRTVTRLQGVTIPVEKIWDTMVQALSHSLPGSLDTLCEVLGVPTEMAKLKTGKKWIQLFCKPLPANRKERRATRLTHPEEWKQFLEYAGMDIPSMREVRKRMPQWNYPREAERQFWILDQHINDRGVAVDVEFARGAMRAASDAQQRLRGAVQALTEGELESATQRNRTLKYLHDVCGFPMADLTGASIEKLLAEIDLPTEVRELLVIRQQAAATSPAKYRALLNGVSSDGRLRGTLQFCGASRTGRDAGRLFQPQNLPRPSLKAHDIEHGIDAIKHGVEDLLYDNVMELCTSAVRGCIVAAPGRKLVIADLSNIEGRMLAWLAGEEWKLQAFRDFDTVLGHDARGKPIRKGPDLYRVTAGEILGKRHEDVTDDERQGQGKVPELACLLEGTLVLTACGEKPIEEVVPGDLVWDGWAWVPTDGPVFRGEKHVIEYDGLCATPDHRVWVEGSPYPVELGIAAVSGLRLLRSGPRHKIVASEFGQTPDSSEAALHESEGQGVQKLWGTRYRISFRDGRSSLRMGVGEPRNSTRKSGTGSQGQRRPLRAGQPSLVDETGELLTHSTKQANDRATSVSRALPTCEVRGLHPSEPAGDGPHLRGDRDSVVCPELQTKRRVWDLLNCGPLHRFTASGRLVHNCGYGGAVGAFQSMAAIYGVEFEEEYVLQIVRAWRARHKATVNFWYRLEDAVRDAINMPGQVFRAARIAVQRDGEWLRMRLPSGRYLCYAMPAFDTNDGGITYAGVNQYTRRWGRLRTYGGKLVENVTQAASRDILFGWAQRAEDAGYHIVMRVHDELVCETPDSLEYTVDGLVALGVSGEPWSEGLPLAAAGFETHRYRKAD